jgi:NAD(P)-dependent dehydrogenase (short-subunit alcohol dehydrogenase family)
MSSDEVGARHRFSEGVALITGGARGIGAAIASRVAEQGGSVLIADVLDEPAHALAADLAARGLDVAAVHLDVTDEVGWESALARCREVFGAPNMLVNNAGIYRKEAIHEETLDGWQQVMGVNLVGPFLGMKAVLPSMIARKSGTIVNISSIWGMAAVEGFAAYSASKAAVAMLSRNAAVTYAKDGIRVNAVLPGQVQTPMTDESGSSKWVLPKIPLGRVASAEEIADAVVYLLSPEASYITGALVPVDGGYLAV